MSALDTSVTLDDVFHVVNAKRVPVAAELAGYLALEIAEGLNAGHGSAFEVDPRSVYIGEEGSVALVRPRREASGSGASRGASEGEASVRLLLSRLLEASGSKTPALGQVASRAPGAGIGALVEELENALIPVNRAAGRRALARLAREVKRVTQGVGRNAARPRDAEESVRPREPATAADAVKISPVRDDISDLLEKSASAPGPASPGASSLAADPDFSSLNSVPADPMAQLASASSLAVTAAPAAGSFPLPSIKMPPEPARPGVAELLADFGVSGPQEHEAMARELKALVGLDPTPPPMVTAPAPAPAPAASRGPHGAATTPAPPAAIAPPVSRPVAHAPIAPPRSSLPSSATDDGGIEALLAETANMPPASTAGADAPVQLSTVAATARSPRAKTRGGVPAREISRSLADAKPAMRTDRILLGVALALAAGAGAWWYIARPLLFVGKPTSPALAESNSPASGATGTSATGSVASASSAASAAPTTLRPARDVCRGSLAINEAPDGAEILIREGQAPLDVASMPVGARLEFVATADGFAPKRAVVPANAQWDQDRDRGSDARPDGGARYELGVQLEPTKAKAGQADPWPSAEPGTSVGGDGPPGVVHIASTPKGAEVWLLAGLGPATRIDQIRCDVDVDVLVAGPTTYRKRLHVAAADFAAAPQTAGPGGVVVRTVTLSSK